MYHDEEDYDAMHYEMEITFNVRVAKWRMNDPRDPKNHSWALHMWDVNNEEWVNLKDLNREGEYYYIHDVVILSDDKLRAPAIPGKRK